MHKEKQLALFDAPTLARLRTLFDYPPSEIPGGPVLLGNRCVFKHHEEYGKVITCEK